jgi:hypothetical protein
MNEIGTAFKTQLGMRVSLDTWDEGGAYLHISHRHGSLGVPLTREEAQQMLANLQEVLAA